MTRSRQIHALALAALLPAVLWWSCEIPTKPHPTDDLFSVHFNFDGRKIVRPTPVTISWSDITIENFKHFLVERGVVTPTGTIWSARATVTDSLQTVYIDTLDDDLDFRYRVKVVDRNNQFRAGQSDILSVPEVRTLIVPTDYATIQPAIDSDFLDDADSVIVLAGAYLCSLNLIDKDIILRAPSGPEFTTIEGIPGAIHPLLHMNSGKVSGFLFSGGIAYSGGGIKAEGASKISNCVILENRVIPNPEAQINVFPFASGGGIHAMDDVIIRNCIITNNAARTFGGGVILEDRAVIESCMIYGNRTKIGGGGIYLHNNFSGVIKNCRIYKNFAMDRGSGNGGGIYITNGSVELTNNIFVKNSAGITGGGAFITGPAEVTIVNCVFYKNSANGYSGEYGAVGGGASYHFLNTIFKENGARLQNRFFGTRSEYCINDQMSFESSGNIYGDPLFMDVESNNFTLAPGSPGIDAGHPDSQYNDVDGSRNDIGVTGGPFGFIP